MNLSNALTLINQDITTLKGQYRDADKIITFKVTKTLSDTLKVGDTVVVESHGPGCHCVVVIGIDETSDVDPESQKEPRWAFQKLDFDHLNEMKKAEAANLQALVLKRVQSMRGQVMGQLGMTTQDTNLLSAPFKK